MVLVVPGVEADEDHREEEDSLAGVSQPGRPAVAQIEITVAELLRALPVTICLTFFIVNFVLSRAATACDSSL